MSILIFTVGLGTITGVEKLEDGLYTFTTGTPTPVKYEISILEDNRLIFHRRAGRTGSQVFKYGEKVILVTPTVQEDK